MKKIIRNIATIVVVGLYWTVESITWVIAMASDIIYMVSRMIKYGALKVLSKLRQGENPLGCRGTEWNKLIDEAKRYDEEMACKLDNLRVI